MIEKTEFVILDKEHIAIQTICNKDKRFAKVVDMVGEIKYKAFEKDGFSFLVHEIIEQMLSVKAGKKIYMRLVDLCGGVISPLALSELSVEDIRSVGTSTSKANYIKGVALAVLSGELLLDEFYDMSDEEVLRKLTNIKGIGTWTAKMYLLFVLDRQDILPFEDVAFLQTYKWMYKTDDVSKEAVIKKCKKWKPYSSYASRYLYRALDMGLTKEEFHLFK